MLLDVKKIHRNKGWKRSINQVADFNMLLPN